jgi:hypothetical protein
MTDAFESEAKFRDDIRRTGATQWQVILVNGSGKKAKKAAKEANKAAKKASKATAAPKPKPTHSTTDGPAQEKLEEKKIGLEPDK